MKFSERSSCFESDVNGRTVLCKSNASKFRENFLAFHGFFKKFRFKRNFRDFSTNFQGTYCFITPKLSNHNSQWTLMSHEILRESSLFSISSRELSKENSLWLLRVLIQTERNTAAVRDLLLCKETQRMSEIRFINSINCYIDLTC